MTTAEKRTLLKVIELMIASALATTTYLIVAMTTATVAPPTRLVAVSH